MEYCLVTVRNSSYEKVMFSQACVKNSVHGGCIPPLGRPPNRHPLGRHPPNQTPPPLGRHPPPRRPLQQTVPHPTGMHSCFRSYCNLSQNETLPQLKIDLKRLGP